MPPFFLVTDEVLPFVPAYFLWSVYWAWACWFVATEKSRNPGWGWAGFFFGPFAFLPLAAAPDLTEYDRGFGLPAERLRERFKSQRGQGEES